MSAAGKVFILIGIVLILFAAVCLAGLLDTDTEEFALVGIILLPIGVIFALLGMYLVALARQRAYLLAEGIDGQAKVIQWWLFSKSEGVVSYVENCKFELEVMVAGKTPYQVSHRQPTPIGLLEHLREGVILPVKVHPKKPKKLLLDWDRMETQVDDGGEKRELKDRLSELEGAYREGLIARDEYESKRAEILKDL